MRAFIHILPLLLLFSCAHSHHQSATDVSLNPLGRPGTLIKAESEQFVFLGFTTSTQYVEEARDKLLAQCPTGSISPLTTHYYTSLGVLSWTNRIRMEGICLPR